MARSDSKVKAMEEGLTPSISSNEKTTTTKVVNKTLSSTSNIAKVLPTGILFVFQAFSNLLSNNGECQKSNKILVGILLGVLGVACFVLSLVDTFVDSSTDNVQYGIATINGIATVGKAKPLDKSQYKIKFKDLAHALLAFTVFAGMALTDQNIVQCFYPSAESNIKRLLKPVPVLFTVASSVIFALFPSERNGITSPTTTTS